MYRRLTALALAGALLVGCRGTQPYTALDLQQVRAGYASIRPVYDAFKSAFNAKNRSAILYEYSRERSACHAADVIDKRDTIDPNVQLFQASVALDDMCNTIDSAYAYWAIKHGLPYDKTITPGRPLEVFVGTDAELEKFNGYMKHPASFS